MILIVALIALWLAFGAITLLRLHEFIDQFPYPREWMRKADYLIALVLGPIGLILTFIEVEPLASWRKWKDS